MQKKCTIKSMYMLVLGASLLLASTVSANPIVLEDIDEAEELIQSMTEQDNNDNLVVEPVSSGIKQEVPNTSEPVVLPPCPDYPSCFPSGHP